MNEEVIVFFDGNCLFCQGSLRWLHRLDDADALRFAPLGGKTAKRWGVLTTSDDSMGLVVDGEVYRASEAARLAFWYAGGVGVLVALLIKAVPFRFREWGYRWLAKNRLKLGDGASCAVPEAGLREKMLE